MNGRIGLEPDDQASQVFLEYLGGSIGGVMLLGVVKSKADEDDRRLAQLEQIVDELCGALSSCTVVATIEKF